MDKQEFIGKAVDELKGIWCSPSLTTSWYIMSGGVMANKNYDETFTREEFEKRARELGWINGYKYGVEYETNGNKPDLPDDVRIEWINGDRDDWAGNCTVRSLNWAGNPLCMPVEKFRIVDERYKPVYFKCTGKPSVDGGKPVEVDQVQDDKPKKDLSDAIFAMLDAVDVLIDAGEIKHARQLKDAANVIQAKQKQKLADEKKKEVC